MKKIYLMFTYTGTVLSRIIRTFTRYNYSHVSISLDEELKVFYSFGRIWVNNPLIAGFVSEELDKGLYAKKKNTICKVYEIKVNDKQYEKIGKQIKVFEENKNIYRYNLIGLFSPITKIPFKLRKNNYFCCEFVGEILIEAGVLKDMNPLLLSPKKLEQKIKGLCVYEGILKNIKIGGKKNE